MKRAAWEDEGHTNEPHTFLADFPPVMGCQRCPKEEHDPIHLPQITELVPVVRGLTP